MVEARTDRKRATKRAKRGAKTTAVKPLSLAALGRRLGVSQVAVLKAVRGRRLSRSLVWVKGRAKVADLELAVREWEANTDLSEAPASVQLKAQQRQAAAAREPGESLVSPLVEASARERSAKAKLAELEYARKAGELVPAAEVEARWLEMITRSRTKLLGLPSKAKQSLPHLTAADLKILDRIVREALEELAGEGAP